MLSLILFQLWWFIGLYLRKLMDLVMMEVQMMIYDDGVWYERCIQRIILSMAKWRGMNSSILC